MAQLGIFFEIFIQWKRFEKYNIAIGNLTFNFRNEMKINGLESEKPDL